MVEGRSWVASGVGRRVMVVVGGVVGLWWWWLKERSSVTRCDICITFKVAREITHVISRDLLAACSKTPPVLLQSGQGEISPLRTGPSSAQLCRALP